MKAYKFLQARTGPDGSTRFLGPFSGFRWPVPDDGRPAAEVGVPGPPDRCRTGVAACRVRHLPYWIQDTLWTIELRGDVQEDVTKLTASRGRLVARVAGWDEAARADFAGACVLRLRDRAAALVEAAGLAPEAEALRAADQIADLPDVAFACRRAVSLDDGHDLVRLVQFVADAAEAASAGLTAVAGYVAAHGMQHAATHVDPHQPLDVDEYVEERDRQAAWFTTVLGLHDDE